MNNITIEGILPPMLTPFTEQGEVDYDAHVRNLERWNKDDLGGYLVLGSNSETAYLTETEKLKLIELTVQHTKKGRTVLAGTGLESTRETIRLTNLAADIGAHAALLLTPNFYTPMMTDESLVHHYRQIADASCIPILIYNVPVYTHLVISVNAVKILSEHPNIIGMKDSSGDVPRLAQIKSMVKESFHLIVGTTSALYPALTLGIRAAVLAPANFAGTQCAKVQRLYNEGKISEAKELYYKLMPVNTAVTSLYGIAGMKYAATLLGYEGGYVRSPLLPVPKAAQDHIRQILITAELM